MSAERVGLERPDGHRIELRQWLPAAEPRAVIQVLHGMSEHAGRYQRLADACTAAGYAVVAHDHRGHGEAAEPLGHFADRDGWDRVIEDALAVNEAARALADRRPLLLFGHSMGSYVAQSQVMRAPGSADALLLSGSTWPKRIEVRVARLVASVGARLRGPRTPARLLDSMSFGAFNKGFAPNRTPFDWLSRDPSEVDRYVADPLCGAPASHAFWRDLLGALLEISDAQGLARVPVGLPILITGGAQDPVGGARRLALLADAYRASGKTDVTLTLYPEGRHEMLNETNRDEFVADLLDWIEATVRRL